MNNHGTRNYDLATLRGAAFLLARVICDYLLSHPDLQKVMNLHEEALAWNERNPEDSISAFACRYPGQYGEAAAALREVRRTSDGEGLS